MATKGDCLKLFLRYLDEATKKGIELPETKNADYRDKFNYFLNESLKYMAGLIKIPAVFQVTHNPIPSQLGLLSGFDIRQYLPGKPIILTGVGTKSYHFEIDNIGTVTIAVNGVTVDTIENIVKRIFTAHKGNITATDTDIVTVTFGGDYPYNIRNTALFAYPFATDDDVPDYTRYVEYAMPSDFMSFDTVILRSDPAIYEIYKGMKWENNKKVILEYFKPGSFDIHYYRYPAEVLPTALDTVELDIEDKGVDLLALDIAIRATAADNPSLSSWLRSLFIEKAQNVIGDDVAQETKIETVYSMMM
jgi:hypothetical protein